MLPQGRRCTRVLGERHLCRGDGVHLDDVVAVEFRVPVALIQQGGTHPVGVALHSLRLQKNGIISITLGKNAISWGVTAATRGGVRGHARGC